VDAGGFLAHEGARGPAHAVNDRDIAGKQIGELCQEQRRPQFVHQLFVEDGGRQVTLRVGIHDRQGDIEVTLAAAGRDDHVHPRQDFLIAFDAGGIQRQPGGISADPLPQLHLALIALLRDLGVEADGGDRMNHIWRET
ncbi:hypothetical protein QT20_00080, partial [Staphylococcus aureus]